MFYKKIIRNQNLRKRILKMLNVLPDIFMIRIQYFIKTGRILNLTNPKRYTEKIQWYKLNYRLPLMTKCSDKYQVREYVKSKRLGKLLNDLYGVYYKFSEIDFNSLPNSFVIKHSSGSGANYFVQNKEDLNYKNLAETIGLWLKNDDNILGREWGYYNVESRIIIEKLLDRDENNDLPDYKFFCFNGRVEYLYTMINYTDDHSKGQCSFFSREFEKLPYRRSEYSAISAQIKKPENFDNMVSIAEILSKEFPHVRVDLYNIKGEIVFGELTFYNAAGYTVFTPDEFDFILGQKFKLPVIQTGN
jgi:hypothetical protein